MVIGDLVGTGAYLDKYYVVGSSAQRLSNVYELYHPAANRLLRLVVDHTSNTIKKFKFLPYLEREHGALLVPGVVQWVPERRGRGVFYTPASLKSITLAWFAAACQQDLEEMLEEGSESGESSEEL